MEAKPSRCTVCKHPVSLRAGGGRRRLALIEDGVALCDVCALAAERQPGTRFER